MLCRIHHGAYDVGILGVDPEYRIHHALQSEMSLGFSSGGAEDLSLRIL